MRVARPGLYGSGGGFLLESLGVQKLRNLEVQRRVDVEGLQVWEDEQLRREGMG